MLSEAKHLKLHGTDERCAELVAHYLGFLAALRKTGGSVAYFEDCCLRRAAA